jgi:DNA-binding NtrC family response regulator
VARNGLTLLCVEDDSGVREFYQQLFTTFGYQVVLAKTCGEALELFQANDIAAVITDFSLPGGNGAVLASQLKRLSPGLPILLISGSYHVGDGPPEDVDVAMEKGVPIREILGQVEALIAAHPPAFALGKAVGWETLGR